MLQIKNICKEYRTGSLVQKALDDVSLNLRDNEFVAILGPSGSGKSTLLNIIGGLDRYDSGDLVINGVSTKKYKDRDWDSYRNHTIGFIFQSYNLIPHQTVLSNVELALTISGISSAERKKRAQDALEKVGLGDQMHKKPNQMSGGQMQRVAIARALVNDPDILLADEPTGALDTETSIQVMNLLKEVAQDRLVVMVTHNPELAEQYANRIVKVKDGYILNDSNPYNVIDEGEAVHKNLGKSSMSFVTALYLSVNNLMTKKTRTLLVAFAGSIGIIGIALIMSLSNGVDKYIEDIESETLSEYPLTIDSSSFDLTSLIEAPEESDKKEEKNKTEEKDNKDKAEKKDNAEVRERKVVSNMFSKMSSNDLVSLKNFIDSGDSDIDKYSRAIEYNYGIEPIIYRQDGEKYHQVNPDTLLSSSGLAPTSSIYSSMFSTNTFNPLPSDSALYKKQYEVKAGRWPKNYSEVVVVLSPSGSITDVALYTLGLKDYNRLEDMIKKMNSKETSEKVSDDDDENATYKYSDLIDIKFKLVNASDRYSYESTNKVWADRSNDNTFMKQVLKASEELTVVGVVKPSKDTNASPLVPGISYSHELKEHVMKEAADSPVVKAQMAKKDINIFTGKPFNEDNSSDFDMKSLISIDRNAISSAFVFDSSKINTDISKYLNLSTLNINQGQLDMSMFGKVINESLKQPTDNQLNSMFNNVLQNYLSYSSKDPSTDYGSLGKSMQDYLSTPEARDVISRGLQGMIISQNNINAISSGIQAMMNQITQEYLVKVSQGYTGTLQDYMQSQEVQNKIFSGTSSILSTVTVDDSSLTNLASNLYRGYEKYAKENGTADPSKMADSFRSYLASEDGQKSISRATDIIIDKDKMNKSLQEAFGSMMKSYSKELESVISKAMEKMMTQLPSAFSVNPASFEKAFKMNMDQAGLTSFMSSMMSGKSATYDSNLSSLGYATKDNPSSISIYPKNFESKDKIKEILEDYNRRMKDAGEDEKVINYTDMVGTLMSSVTTIINTISYVLIAFVAISLVVSSIMIGVITYISVLERKKEIGILRAIGASKKNISNVFNAETFITGLLAGMMGIGITVLLLIPANSIIHSVSGNENINAILPVQGAIFLILLSVILTLIGGIIPAQAASKSDPVAALRTD